MLQIKRGDTLNYSGFLPEGWLPEGAWSVLAAARDKKTGTKYDIEATLTPPAGDETRYFLRLYAKAVDTALWPVAKMSADVQFTDSSAEPDPVVFSSDTFQLVVVEDVA